MAQKMYICFWFFDKFCGGEKKANFGDGKVITIRRIIKSTEVGIDEVVVERKSITIVCHVAKTGEFCPNCGVESSQINQYYYRTVRDLNMGERYVYLRVKIRQYYCKSCHRYYSEMLDFTDLNKEYTHRQTDYMFCLARNQSYTEVAAIVDVFSFGFKNHKSSIMS